MRSYIYSHNMYDHVPIPFDSRFIAQIVDEDTGHTVHTIEGYGVFRNGAMAHSDDLPGLHDYLESIGVIRHEDGLYSPATMHHGDN